jgi:hypothetical protein
MTGLTYEWVRVNEKSGSADYTSTAPNDSLFTRTLIFFIIVATTSTMIEYSRRR